MTCQPSPGIGRSPASTVALSPAPAVTCSTHPALARSPTPVDDADDADNLSQGFAKYKNTIVLSKEGRGYQPKGYWGADDGADPTDAAARSQVEYVSFGSLQRLSDESQRSRGGSDPGEEDADEQPQAAPFGVHQDTELLNQGVQAAATSLEVHQDTELLPAVQRTAAEFSVREDTECLPHVQQATGVFELHEDTELLPPVQPGSESFAVHQDTELLPTAQASGMFAVHEDTELLPRAQRRMEPFAVREDTEVLPAAAPSGETFAVHQDTELLPKAPAQRLESEFAAHEDTELLSKAPAAEPFAVHEDTELLHSLQHHSAGFSVHQDTELLPKSQQATGAFSVRQDTELLPPGQQRTSSFSVHQDTELLPNATRPDASKKAASPALVQAAAAPLLSPARRDTHPALRRTSSDGGFDCPEGTPEFGLDGESAQRLADAFKAEPCNPAQHVRRGLAAHAAATPAAAFSVHEDTELLPRTAQHTGCLEIHQDTELSPEAQLVREPFSVHQDTELLPRTQPLTEAFAVHKDTELLPVSKQRTGPLEVHQDTELLPAGPHVIAKAAVPVVHQDTELLPMRPSPCSGSPSVNQGGPQRAQLHRPSTHDEPPTVREATELLPHGRSVTGTFPIHEDSELLPQREHAGTCDATHALMRTRVRLSASPQQGNTHPAAPGRTAAERLAGATAAPHELCAASDLQEPGSAEGAGSHAPEDSPLVRLSSYCCAAA